MKARAVISVAADEVRHFFLNARVMVLGMLLIFTDNLVVRVLLERADKTGIPLNAAEPFVAVCNSGILLLFLPAVFLILASDFPHLGSHTLFVMHRTKRLPWLIGKTVGALFCTAGFIGVIFVFCALLTLRNGTFSLDWSDTVTKYAAMFPGEQYTLASKYLPPNLYNQMPFPAALLHSVLSLMLYLFLLCLILSFFRILGKRTAAIAAAFSVVAGGVVTTALETDAKWFFPMANTIPWLHYSEALRAPVRPMSASYLYFGIWIGIGLLANALAVRRTNIQTMEAE